MPGSLDRMHHGIRSDHYQPVDHAEGNLGFVKVAESVGRHRIDNVADECFVLNATRSESRSFVAAPNHDVRGLFDLLHLVTVDLLLVTGEVDRSRPARSELLANREQDSVPKTAAHQQR